MLESQAMWAMFVFQGLSAPLYPQCQSRLARAVEQTRLQHKDINHKTWTQTRTFQDKSVQSAGVKTTEEVNGGETEKTERERDCHVYSDTNLSTFRKGQ